MSWGLFQSRPIDMSGTAQTNLAVSQIIERREERKRDEERRRRSEQTASAKELQDEVARRYKNTGTIYDPALNAGVNDILDDGFKLFAKGVNYNDAMMALGPKFKQLNDYSSKAKAVQQKKEADLKAIKETPGYDLAKFAQEYDNRAFYKVDPSTGQRVMKTPDEIDLNENIVAGILRDAPETVSTAEGINKYFDKLPMQESVYETQSEKAGIINKEKYKSELPYFMEVATGSDGKPAARVKGSPIMDGDKPILGEGGQPMMAIDKDTYRRIMKEDPGTADYIRGQVRQSFPADKVPPEDSAAWEMQARHILYDEASRRNKSKLSFVESQRLNPDGRKVDAVQSGMIPEIRIYNEQTPRARIGRSGGKAPSENISTTEAIAKIFTNDPAYIEGGVVDVDGREMIDVTYGMPNGFLKYGPAADDKYQGIYYDPETKELVVEDKYGNTKSYNENNIGQLMSSTATLNKTNAGKVGKVSDVRSILDKYGYKDGKFTGARETDTNPIQEIRKAKEEEKKQKIEEFEGSGDVDILSFQKGKITPEGKILKISKTSPLNLVNDYYIEVEKDGKKKEIKFKDEKALSRWLLENGSSSDSKKTKQKAILD